MNIAQAKTEIIHTVRTYLQRDASGAFVIPVEKQRPILLMGPPGIGKTAIMEQAAHECGVNLVSYTITHHTRQSAIGLPFISKRDYDGQEYAVTEYTMSEIIASIYDQIELSGVREGILFLDEINCVSETLSPTMLQFLQYKTFGAHKVPDGFVIVTAGNPPEYNASVRDFDIVTLDRVRRIDVEADYDAWRAYAMREGVHGAILAYLEIRKEHFYGVRVEPEGKRFVTARGWEDLSRVMQAQEALELPVTKDLVRQFLQDETVADAFATYYDLWNKYKDLYDVPSILDGKLPAEKEKEAFRRAPFDEKLSIISLLTEKLTTLFAACALRLDVLKRVRELLAQTRDLADGKAFAGREGATELADDLETVVQTMAEALRKQETAHFIDAEEAKITRGVIGALEDAARMLIESAVRERADDDAQATADAPDAAMSDEAQTTVNAPDVAPPTDAQTTADAFDLVRAWFAERERARVEKADETGARLTNAFSFLTTTFGEGQEVVLFLTQLGASHYALRFVAEHGNDAYFKYNRLLLLDDRRRELTDELLSLDL